MNETVLYNNTVASVSGWWEGVMFLLLNSCDYIISRLVCFSASTSGFTSIIFVIFVIDTCFKFQTEEKLAHLLEKLELADQKLAKQAEQLPTVEAEVQQRLRALSKVMHTLLA